MVSGLNQQQNRNLQYGANGSAQNVQVGMQNYASNNMTQSPMQNPAGNYNSGQNFGQLTAKPDTFENNSNDPNFGTIDREALQAGAQEVSKTVEDNMFVQMIKNFFGIDIHNPKKTLISLGLTLTTVIGLAKFGNSKFSTKTMPELGHKVSNALKGNSVYTSITNSLTKAKDNVVGFLRKSKTIDDIFETFKNRRAQAVNQWAKGTGTGLKRIFSLTAPDTLETSLTKMVNPEDAAKLASLKSTVVQGEKAARKLQKAAGKNIEADKLASLNELIAKGKAAEAPLQALQDKIDKPKLESLKKLVGESKAKEMLDTIGGDSMDVSNKLTELIGENFGFIKDGKIVDYEGMNKIFNQIKDGKITGLDGKLNIDVSEFTNIVMNNNKGLMAVQGNWWPVNFANNIGRKIRGDKWKDFGRGNLGDALLKYNVIAGKGTDTKIGSIIQQSVLFPTEAISNFVNDKSGLGFFLCGMIMNLYNNVQDAPKEKKAATLADDFMGTIGSLAITTPLACATMYGLATLGNVKGNSVISKYLLKPVGKFFGAGLGQKWKNVIANPSGSKVKDFFRQVPGRTVGFAGGAMRLLLVMFVFQGIFGKPLRNITNKIFGKPYDPSEETQQQQLQAQAKNMEAAMKNLNLTEEQMVAKLQAHPEFVTALQNDPKTLAAIQKDPTLLLQLIAQLPDGAANGAQNSGGVNPASNNGIPQGNKFANSAGAPSSLLNNHINNPSNISGVSNNNQGMQLNNQQQPVNKQTQPTQPAQVAGQTSQTSTETQTAKPASQKQESGEPVRTYIPSSKPFNYVEGDTNTIKQEEITNSNVQAMLSKADKAEQEAMKILG